jgi:hypothetical protein
MFVTVSARDNLVVTRSLVTLHARELLVRTALEVESVVESGALPGVGIVTALASPWEIRSGVVGVCCQIIGIRVTPVTVIGNSNVIKSGALPGVGIVTALTALGEGEGHVIRVGRAVEVF